MRAWVGVLILCAGCYQDAVDDDSSPVASSIATAAHSAVGADYPPPGGQAGGTASTGIVACDAYFKKIANCKGVPPSTQSAFRETAKAMRETIERANTPEAKVALEEACKAAIKALTVCDTGL